MATVRDNGVQGYIETREILVFRNHGETHWCAMRIDDGAYRLLGQTQTRNRYGIVTGYSYPTFKTAEKAMRFARAALKGATGGAR